MAVGRQPRRGDQRGAPRFRNAPGDRPCQRLTKALQAWLDDKALPNEPGAASQQQRIGAGGTYMVTNTIVCNDNTTIHAHGIEYVGPGASTYNGVAPFQIAVDAANWAGATDAPLFQMKSYCRISGVSLVSTPTVDTVLIAGFHAIIDEHSTIIGGRNNVIATGTGTGVQQTGFQIKDSQVLQASQYNLNYNTPNTRLIGDVIGGAGVANIYFTGAELTIANGIIEESQGDGILLDGASFVKIVGNQINHNGKGSTGGYGLRIRGGSQHVTVTGNEMNKNNFGLASGAPGSSHVALQANIAALVDVTLSGNVYSPFANAGGTLVPDFVYDLQGPSTNFMNLQIYEAASVQGMGVYTMAAQTVLSALGPAGPPGPLH